MSCPGAETREIVESWSLFRPASGDDGGGLVEAAPAASLREVFRRFWLHARPFWRWLWLSLVLIIVGPVVDAGAILLFKVLVVGVTLLVGILGFVGQYLGAWIAENLLHRMRTRVFAHLHTLSVSFSTVVVWLTS